MIDVVGCDIGYRAGERHRGNRESLAEALDESTELIRNSRSPVILAGVEVPRFGIQRDLARLAEAYNIPIATTLLGKSAIQETHPLHVGIYAASIGRPEVCRLIEKSDCVIMLGTFLTDIDSGIATPPLEPENCIYATSERLQIQHHHFDGVQLQDFVRGLARQAEEGPVTKFDSRLPRSPGRSQSSTKSLARNKKVADRLLKVPRLFELLDGFLAKNMMVIADVGDSLFGSIDLVTHRQTDFLGMAYYTSMGFAIPAALGAGLADRKRRPVVTFK